VRITQGASLLPAIQRGEPFNLEIDGRPVQAFPGETIAAVLMAMGRRAWQHAEGQAVAGAVYCGIGLCFGCLVTVDDVAGVRACVTPARAGMRIRTAEQEAGSP